VGEGIQKLVGKKSEPLAVRPVLAQKEFGDARLIEKEWFQVVPLIGVEEVDRILLNKPEETDSGNRGGNRQDGQDAAGGNGAALGNAGRMDNADALTVRNCLLPTHLERTKKLRCFEQGSRQI